MVGLIQSVIRVASSIIKARGIEGKKNNKATTASPKKGPQSLHWIPMADQ